VDQVGHRVLRFDRFVLDLTRGCLRVGACDIHLSPKAFEVLRHLAKHGGRLAPKEELLATVWPNVIVSDDSLVQCIRELRQKLADEEHRLIKTVPRRGYLLDVEISADTVMVQPPRAMKASADIGVATALSLTDRPSIAVLPFNNLSGDPEQEYLADGVVEDIITELSRFRELFVIARNSSFAYKGKAVDVRLVGRELGIRYVLEGSVRRAGDRIRVAAQLIEAENGGHLWAEKYEHDYSHVFALHDEVTRSVVGAIQPQILLSEGQRAARKNPTSLDAFDSLMRGMWHVHQRTRDDNRQAESWFTRSIELDPKLARAHMMLSRVLSGRCWVGDSEDIERDLRASQAAAERAVGLDERDAAVHYALSIISLMTRQHERALVASQRAVDLNANLALGHFALGETRLFMGQFDQALDELMRSLRLSPLDSLASTFVSLIALAHYHLGNYREAVHHSERALQKRRTYFALRTLAAAQGRLGWIKEAHRVLTEMERLRPTDQRQWALVSPYADEAHEAQVLDGLRLAGRPPAR
jgi:TolB-like protein/tetratricopeptide (TPR) repeat protein